MNARSQPTLVKAVRALRAQIRTKTARPAPVGLPVFVIYADVGVAREALHDFRKSLRGRHPTAEPQPMLWRIDQLAEPRWREMTLRDAALAGCILVAFRQDDPLPEALDRWLSALLAHLRGVPLSVFWPGHGGEPWALTLADTCRDELSVARDKTKDATEVFASVAPKSAPACAA
jgi:hypothetical protein